jgi:hypothetical protein
VCTGGADDRFSVAGRRIRNFGRAKDVERAMRLLLAAPALVLLFAGCSQSGGDDVEPRAPPAPPAASRTPPAPPPTSATGPGLTVSAALRDDVGGPLLVRGLLYESEGEIRLCEALAESYPPQCGGAWLVVQGISLSDVEGVQTAGGVSWTDNEVKLRGEIEKGTLTVSDTAQP